MGLDTTHDCWHGAYSRFSRFRDAIADAANIRQVKPSPYHVEYPDIEDDNPLAPFLAHSDCDGDIAVEYLVPLADALDAIAPKLEGVEDFAERARQFAAGCRNAAAAGEAVGFH